MLRLKLYYHAKPFLPWSLRMAVRRFFATKKRRLHQNTWPIDPSTSDTPAKWSGWPDDKRFAFLLSHDIETQVGYDKIDQLLEVEETLGFRSVINFIPEGQYRVSKERIQNLKSRGFEIGVHGLHHDGKLYNHRSTFEKRAVKINQYLKDWDATGFRSPLMHHKLDWLHSLNIAYDTSTFDTDPFEPQNDALGTIFPLWIAEQRAADGGRRSEDGSQRPEVRRKVQNIKSPNSDLRSQTSDLTSPISNISPQSSVLSPQSSLDGYVELPYTLPQDSTLFLLLREKTNTIWREKTAWIAKHGGIAFVNVHPDYIDFSDQGNGSQSTYPVSYYKDFLEHVKSAYAGQYWHATPGECAKRFVRGL